MSVQERCNNHYNNMVAAVRLGSNTLPELAVVIVEFVMGWKKTYYARLTTNVFFAHPGKIMYIDHFMEMVRENGQVTRVKKTRHTMQRRIDVAAEINYLANNPDYDNKPITRGALLDAARKIATDGSLKMVHFDIMNDFWLEMDNEQIDFFELMMQDEANQAAEDDEWLEQLDNSGMMVIR